jgi:hypothetical protein
LETAPGSTEALPPVAVGVVVLPLPAVPTPLVEPPEPVVEPPPCPGVAVVPEPPAGAPGVDPAPEAAPPEATAPGGPEGEPLPSVMEPVQLASIAANSANPPKRRQKAADPGDAGEERFRFIVSSHLPMVLSPENLAP